MNTIVVKLQPGGTWVAKRTGSDGPRGKGPSSVEAHLDLLEREERAGALRKDAS